ncbi:MAG: hypothetical protein HOO06_06905 [Bdellovibrionaceae bacterium]|nr:hypothetical protein [Pseudobdellovibrionaceae bacterium]
MIVTFLFEEPVIAACYCKGSVNGKKVYSEKVKNKRSCFNRIMKKNDKELLTHQYCESKNDFVGLKWGCGKLEDKPNLVYNVKCNVAMLETAEVLISSILNVTPHLSKTYNKSCYGNPNLQDSTIGLGIDAKLNVEKVRIIFETKEDLLKATDGFIPGEVFDRSKDDFEVSAHLPNDNKGLGLFKAIFEKANNDDAENDEDDKDKDDGVNDGDDEGRTHGMKLKVSKGLSNKYHLTIEYSSDLYTQIQQTMRRGAPDENGISSINFVDRYADDNGVIRGNQHFLEDNLFKILIDNKDKEDLSFYKAGFGWHQINQNKLGNVLFSSARQQQVFHGFVNGALNGNTTEYEYITTDTKLAWVENPNLSQIQSSEGDTPTYLGPNYEDGPGSSNPDRPPGTGGIKSASTETNVKTDTGPEESAFTGQVPLVGFPALPEGYTAGTHDSDGNYTPPSHILVGKEIPKKNKEGMYLELGGGIQNKDMYTSRNRRLRIGGEGELETTFSNADPMANRLTAKAKVDFSYQKNSSSSAYRMSYKVQSDNYYEENHTSLSHTVEIQFAPNESYHCGMSVTKRQSHGPGYVNYDPGNEDIHSVNCDYHVNFN